MSESSSFQPPPNNIFINLVPIQAEKALGSSIGCIYGISELNIAVSDMSAWCRYLLDDNIHRFCLLVIECL